MPKQDKNASRMRGHDSRTQQGSLRRIRDDTKIKTLEKRYGVEFPDRSDMEWGTFQKKHRVASVKDALKKFG